MRLLGILRIAAEFLADDGSRRGGFSRMRGSASGSALAEFALAFPFQLFLTFGMIQLMLLLVSSLMVNYASFRCCRAALVNYSGDADATAAAIKPVAQVLLAPLGIANHTLNDSPAGWGLDGTATAIAVPGWGDLRGSAETANKVHIEVSDNSGVITLRLSYLQEMYFPFIDKLIALITHTSATKSDGRGFAGATEENGGAWVSANGRVYLILTRSHVMRRDALISNVAAASDVYQYKCDGW